MRALKTLMAVAALALAIGSAKANHAFSHLIGKTLEYSVEQFGPAHYEKTTNYILHNRNHGLVDVYLFDIGWGYLEVWVSQNQMGKMPARRIVFVRSYDKNSPP
jgi:hypothetical protein